MERRVDSLLFLALILISGSHAWGAQPAAAPPPAAESPVPIESPAPAAEVSEGERSGPDHPELEALRREIEALREEAREKREGSQNQVSLIVSLMEVFLGFLAVLLGVAVYVGFTDRKQMQNDIEELRTKAKELKEEAASVLEKAQSAAQQTTLSAQRAAAEFQHISKMRDGLQHAWGQTDKAFKNLGIKVLERNIVLGDLPPQIAKEDSVIFEDEDTVLLVFDQLGITSADAVKSARHFLRLGRYWRIIRDFPRALERIERADRLDPGNPEVLLHLGKTLNQWAAMGPGTPEVRSELLKRAGRILEEALKKEMSSQGQASADLLAEIAWGLDELGEIDQAVHYYERARSAAKEEREVWDHTYNLAACLAKSGRFERALSELARVIDKDRNWEDVVKDQDFAELRESSPWKEQFEGMVKKARAADPPEDQP